MNIYGGNPTQYLSRDLVKENTDAINLLKTQIISIVQNGNSVEEDITTQSAILTELENKINIMTE